MVWDIQLFSRPTWRMHIKVHTERSQSDDLIEPENMPPTDSDLL